MSALDDYYAANQGKSVLFDGVEADRGQCLQWVELVNRDVYHAPAFLSPGAIDWWNSFGGSPIEPYYDKITDGSIKKGDIVVFNTKVGSQFGHIDVALQDGALGDFVGADSNWGGDKTVHQVHHVGIQYVLGALRPKGNDMPDTIETLQSAINSLTNTVNTLQSALNAARSDDEIHLSALNAARAQVTDLQNQLATASSTGNSDFTPYIGDPLFVKKK